MAGSEAAGDMEVVAVAAVLVTMKGVALYNGLALGRFPWEDKEEQAEEDRVEEGDEYQKDLEDVPGYETIHDVWPAEEQLRV